MHAPLVNATAPCVNYTNTAPYCLMDAFGSALLSPDTIVEVGVAWTGDVDSPGRRTLRVGELHEVSGAQSPLVMDVPFADLADVEKLVVDAVPPDPMGIYTFHVRYGLDDFPLMSSSPVSFG